MGGGCRDRTGSSTPPPRLTPVTQGSAKAPTWAGVETQKQSHRKNGAQLQTTQGVRGGCSTLRPEGRGRKVQKRGQTFCKAQECSRNDHAQGPSNTPCWVSVATPTPRGHSDPGRGHPSSLPLTSVARSPGGKLSGRSAILALKERARAERRDEPGPVGRMDHQRRDPSFRG